MKCKWHFFFLNYLTKSRVSTLKWNTLCRLKYVKTSANRGCCLPSAFYNAAASTAQKSDFSPVIIHCQTEMNNWWTIVFLYFFSRSNSSDLLFITLMSPSFKDYLFNFVFTIPAIYFLKINWLSYLECISCYWWLKESICHIMSAFPLWSPRGMFWIISL